MDKYKSFIIKTLEEVNPYEEIDENTDLIESEILDSLTLVFLVMQIEDRYHIVIDEHLVVPENFRTIHNIYELMMQLIEK